MSAPQDQDYQLPPPPPAPDAEPQAPRPTKRLWPIAIGLFVVGLLLVVAGITGLLTGATGGGGALCFLGLVIFALSFIRLPSVPNPEAPLSWFEKLTGIFYEPSRVFRNLRSNPNWIAPFILIWVLAASSRKRKTTRTSSSASSDQKSLTISSNSDRPWARRSKSARRSFAL